MSKFLLKLYIKANNLGTLLIQTENNKISLKNLTNPRTFLGNMKQLEAAMHNGACLEGYYTLRNIHGDLWLLGCEVQPETVSVKLWITDFGWDGPILDFKKAIRLL